LFWGFKKKGGGKKMDEFRNTTGKKAIYSDAAEKCKS